jgi:benzodiazapine receptor
VLAGFIGLCLLVAVADGAVTALSVRTWYLTLTPPPGTPPNWVFGPVWTVLYVMMAVAAWLVWRVGSMRAVRVWGWQLLLNALWTPAFFGLQSTGLGLVLIVSLLVMVAVTLMIFRRVQPIAALLMVPYLAWVGYATYLNAGFWWLN